MSLSPVLPRVFLRFKTTTLLVLLPWFLACSEAKFASDNRKAVATDRTTAAVPSATSKAPTPAGQLEKSLHLKCDDHGRHESLSIPSQGLKLKVTGEFCPERAAATSLLFVVDFSGSMGSHTDPQSGAKRRGNDPRQGSNCGRLAATNAVLDAAEAQLAARLKSSSQNGAHLRAGLVVFAGDVLTSLAIPMTDIESFRQQMQADNFCNYVAQSIEYLRADNPGALASSEVSSGTNYSAALAAARNSLMQENSDKRVYFISDGEPTVGGSAAAAAQSLRQLPGVTINALLLRDEALSQGSAGEVNARAVLAEVAGSPERVRVASNAAELATQILSFPDASVKAAQAQWMALDGSGKRDLAVTLAAADADGKVAYTLADIVLTPQDAGSQILSVGAKTQDGQDLSADLQVDLASTQ